MVNEVITLLCPIIAAPGRGTEMKAALQQLAAATAKRIAREKKNRALRNNEYFLGQYEADMTQDAIYTETEQRLGRPPRRECLCPT